MRRQTRRMIITLSVAALVLCGVYSFMQGRQEVSQVDIIAQAATARAAQEAALAAQRRAAADAQPVVADPAARQAGVQEAPAGGVVGRESAAKVRKLGGDFDHLAPYPPKPPVSPERLAKYASWVPKAPAPADVRDAKCPNFAAKIKEGAKTTPLPTTSVIFCFCNENKGALYHSMHSVIERTPPELLHEIILVDDGGNSVETGKQLEDYVATLPVTVHIVRLGARKGLMVARVEGARKATGDVLTFLDSHIDPQTDWLEPLLYRVQQDRRHVVMPIIDGLTNDGSYSYKRGGIELVGFNAHLVDHGINLQKKDDFPGRTAVDPQPSPAMAGGLFSVDREYFFHIGAFDEGMGHWGGENIEIGFRVWQCGGTIELIPCSRVGHVFGGMGGGCPWPGAAPGTKNKWRAIRAWMDDEHAAVMQKYLPEPNNVGDISNMHELRDRLQCRSFQWFLDNVYPECWMNTVNHPVQEGALMNPATNKCYNPRRIRMETCAPTPLSNRHDQFLLMSNNAELILSDIDTCIEAPLSSTAAKLTRYACHGQGGNQKWEYSEDTGLLKHGNMCVQSEPLQTAPCNSNEPKQQWVFQKLPKSLLPRNYTLSFRVPDPDTKGLQYSGTSNIDMEVAQATSCVILHSHLLVWSAADVNVLVSPKGGQGTRRPVPVSRVEFEKLWQFGIIHLAPATPLAVGDVLTVQVAFQGSFNHGSQDGSGFFLSNNSYSPASRQPAITARESRRLGWSKFPRRLRQPWEEERGNATDATLDRQEGQNKQLMMYGTQFEETDARRAFPCMDEPDLKAHYQVAITVDGTTDGTNGTLTALTNMRELGPPVKLGGTTTFTFRRTLHPMSSYLVALAVGRFDYIERVQDSVRFRVYTPPGCTGYAQFALDFGATVTQWYSHQWNFSYAEMNDKMDQIAVPSVVENAMENWGLLTYDPSFLLLDSATNPSIGAKQLVAQVTAHEISHQWFGDTITNEFWNSEYLQEGFARLWQYVSVNAIFPEWDVFNGIFKGSAFGDIGFYGWPFNRGMDGDYNGALPAPIVPETQAASSTAFYEKGAALNRMFSRYLGQADWFKGLSHHLREHKYENPRLPDLLSSFAATLPAKYRDFEGIARQWLLQPGMPLVTLTVDGTKKQLGIQQRPSGPKLNQSQVWWVPLEVQFTPQAGGAPSVLSHNLQGRHEFVDLPAGVETSTFLYGNYNYTAFILVNYSDPAQWEHLTAEMSKPSFSAIDRQQLQKQLFYLSSLEGLVGPSFRHLHRAVEMYRAQLASSSAVCNPGVMGPLLDGVVEVWQQIQELQKDFEDSKARWCNFTAEVDRLLAEVSRRTLSECCCRGEDTSKATGSVTGAGLYWRMHTSAALDDCGIQGSQLAITAAWASYRTWAQTRHLPVCLFGSVEEALNQ